MAMVAKVLQAKNKAGTVEWTDEYVERPETLK